MASTLPEGLQSVNVASDDLEEFEVTEIDGALLRDLLGESPEESDETEDDGVGYVLHSLEVKKNDDNVMIDGQDCLEQNVSHIHDFDWLDMVQMAQPLPSDEMMVWYENDMVGMVDFDCNGDYSQFCNGVFSDETAYSWLW
ncbi:hypothetical protein L1049_024043 [Liquidambar formosana]|uniref:Uncharacterized protein n=1 Tax=Liquidambar formosana TaxID=63359 RepID=A0AAP0RVC0_LIQFO